MKTLKILTLLVILMAGIAFSGCIGNSGNDQNTTEEATPVAGENVNADSVNQNSPAKASVSESTTTMSAIFSAMKAKVEKRRVNFASGEILNEDGSVAHFDENADPILGLWEGGDRTGDLKLVFYENNTVSVNFRDHQTTVKTWRLDGKTYRFYDDDGYNSANVTMRNEGSIQYITAGGVQYTLSRVTDEIGEIIGFWDGYSKTGNIQLVFHENGKVNVNFRDDLPVEKDWKKDGNIIRIYDADGYNSANVTFQNADTINYKTAGSILYTLVRVINHESVLTGTWECKEGDETLRLVFTDDGKVVVTYNDMTAETKWIRDGNVYRIYDGEDYNDASVVFRNADTIQYSSSGSLLYTLKRVI